MSITCPQCGLGAGVRAGRDRGDERPADCAAGSKSP